MTKLLARLHDLKESNVKKPSLARTGYLFTKYGKKALGEISLQYRAETSRHPALAALYKKITRR